MFHIRIRAVPLLFVCALAGLISTPARGQIVNTLEGFDGQALGWSGALGGSLRGSGGNSEVFDVEVDARLQRRSQLHRLRALFGYGFSSAQGVDQAEELFGHLRHNRRLHAWLHSLAFVQVQHNPFQNLRSRILLGGGARLDFVQRERGHLSVGAAHMSETESLRGADDGQTVQRLSTFVDLRVPLSEHATLGWTAFFQPRWSRFSDLRAIASAQLEARIAGPLSLISSANLAYDSEPPSGVKDTDWTVRTGLRVRL